jgi:hypothetical protein
VQSPEKFDTLISKLLDGDRSNLVATTTALQGGGRFGKTTLAIALCHDERIRDAFNDGMLWITLGETPDLINILNNQINLFGVHGIQTDINLAAKRLGELLEKKVILIVLDDVWHGHHLIHFMQISLEKWQCAYLITTRLGTVVTASNADAITVDEMEAFEAVQLLTRHLPNRTDPTTELYRLVKRLGEWALLLEIVGAELKNLVVVKWQVMSAFSNCVQ